MTRYDFTEWTDDEFRVLARMLPGNYKRYKNLEERPDLLNEIVAALKDIPTEEPKSGMHIRKKISTLRNYLRWRMIHEHRAALGLDEPRELEDLAKLYPGVEEFARIIREELEASGQLSDPPPAPPAPRGEPLMVGTDANGDNQTLAPAESSPVAGLIEPQGWPAGKKLRWTTEEMNILGPMLVANHSRWKNDTERRTFLEELVAALHGVPGAYPKDINNVKKKIIRLINYLTWRVLHEQSVACGKAAPRKLSELSPDLMEFKQMLRDELKAEGKLSPRLLVGLGPIPRGSDPSDLTGTDATGEPPAKQRRLLDNQESPGEMNLQEVKTEVPVVEDSKDHLRLVLPKHSNIQPVDDPMLGVAAAALYMPRATPAPASGLPEVTSPGSATTTASSPGCLERDRDGESMAFLQKCTRRENALAEKRNAFQNELKLLLAERQEHSRPQSADSQPGHFCALALTEPRVCRGRFTVPAADLEFNVPDVGLVTTPPPLGNTGVTINLVDAQTATRSYVLSPRVDREDPPQPSAADFERERYRLLQVQRNVEERRLHLQERNIELVSIQLDNERRRQEILDLLKQQMLNGTAPPVHL